MDKFKVINTGKLFECRLIYSKREHDFESYPINGMVEFALAVDRLEIDFRYGKKAIQVHGFCPFTEKERKKLKVPQFFKGTFLADSEYEEGMIYRINGTENCWRAFDPESGWFCMCDEKMNEGDKAVEFATNQVAVIDDAGNFKALWLKPEFVDSLE